MTLAPSRECVEGVVDPGSMVKMSAEVMGLCSSLELCGGALPNHRLTPCAGCSCVELSLVPPSERHVLLLTDAAPSALLQFPGFSSPEMEGVYVVVTRVYDSASDTLPAFRWPSVLDSGSALFLRHSPRWSPRSCTLALPPSVPVT